MASQQAVADYLPQIQAQEASIQSLTQDQAQVQADYQQQFGGETAEGAQEAEPRDVLAESIRKAWESVDWQQNRLAEVQQQVTELLQSGAAAAGTVQQPGSEGQREAFVQRLEEIDAELDAEEAALDEMYSFLDELEAARDAAEDAESDARARVEDLSQEQMDTETDIRQQETDLEDTKKWREEAGQNLIEAEKYKKEATGELAQAEHELEHFGEGSSWQSRLEYYNWHGNYNIKGHQLVIGQSFFASEKNIDYGLDTNYVISRSGLRHGSADGWTDTTLFATIKNDHPKYDVHYLFSVNVPTGQETHVNAQLPDGLARHTSFGEGWNFTPGVEITRHINERDSVTGRLTYSMRGGYNYRSDTNSVWSMFQSKYDADYKRYSQSVNAYLNIAESKKDFLQDYCHKYIKKGNIDSVEMLDVALHWYASEPVAAKEFFDTLRTVSYEEIDDSLKKYFGDNYAEGLKQAIEEHYSREDIESTLKGDVYPGNQLQMQLEYMHAGEKEQAFVQAGYSYTEESEQRLRSTLFDETISTSRYKDGSGVWLKAFYSQDVTKHDSWQIFASASYTARTHYMNKLNDSDLNTQIVWWEGGLGWTHEFDPRQRLSLMFTYQKANGNVYLSSIRNAFNSSSDYYWHNPSRRALTLAYTYRLDATSQLEFRLERYNIHDHGEYDLNFHGWGGALMFTKSF